MRTMPIVAAFSDSPRVRETLSILLEHECHVHFLPSHGGMRSQPIVPDVAVVATRAAPGVLRQVTDCWPGLPVVTIDIERPADLAPSVSVRHVPLEPQAIRTAVLCALAVDRYAALRRAIPTMIESLRQEIAFVCALARSMPTYIHHAIRPATATVLGTITREQADALDDVVTQLRAFSNRPSEALPEPEFAGALYDTLETTVEGTHGMPGSCTGISRPTAAGPIALLPIIGGLLRTHLRRHAHTPITTRADSAGLVLRYCRQPLVPAMSWPLLLAAAALRPCSWAVDVCTHGTEESVTLHPVTS